MIRPAHAGELAGLTRALTDAFMGDPLYEALAPSPQARERWLRWVMGMFLRVSHRFGGALCLSRAPDAGAICVIPPEPGQPSLLDYLRAAPGLPPGGSGALTFLRRGALAADVLRRAHVGGAHYYLLAIGVVPAEQGRGVGGALARAALQLAEARGMPCYLETASPRNVAYWEHLGFAVQRALRPPGLPPLWTMLRPPSAAVAPMAPAPSPRCGG